MAFDLPRNVVVPVDAVEVRLDSAPHPFELEHAGAIEENWKREIARNPAFFDGRVTLLSELAYRERRLVGRCHAVRFAALMYWRRNRGIRSAEHAFAFAVLVSADGALVAIRMGMHTASAGAVSFAAGAFEPDDYPGGQADVHLNMTREVAEETGLDISQLPRDATYHLYSYDGGTVIARRYYLPEPAGVIARRIESFVATQEEPEIQGPVIIRDGETLPEGVKPHMRALVGWHFGHAG